MKDFLLNENFSMMGIPSDHLIPLDSTGVTAMSRTIKMTFNVEGRTFNIGYLNFEVDKSVRNSSVHRYYLALDTRLSQFIEFLASLSAENERNSKISNVRQVILEVTYARLGQVFYNVLLKGDSFSGIMKFKPSELKKCERDVETDFSTIEPLIDSIINEKEKDHLSFNILGQQFTVRYHEYDYFQRESHHIYVLVLDSVFFDFLEFLREHYSTEPQIQGRLKEVLLRVSTQNNTLRLNLYGTENNSYEQIEFNSTYITDSDKSHLSKIEQNTTQVEKVVVSDQEIISLCKDIVRLLDHKDKKIQQLRDLLNQ